MTGFFNEATWGRVKLPLVTEPQCAPCGLYRHCLSPKMPPSGKGKKRVMIVAEAPGENEDKKGIQLIGNAGQELIRVLDTVGMTMRRDAWLENAIICRPQGPGGGNRKPTPKEIGYCRPHLSKSLNELQPDVIVPLGDVAIKSVVALAGFEEKDVKKVGPWAGWKIPSVKLNAWICPSYHPSHLARSRGEGRPDAVALELHMAKQLSRAFRTKGKPWPDEAPDYPSKVQITHNDAEAADWIANFIDHDRSVAFDYETTCKKPDGDASEILCCSLSDGEYTIAFPWYGKAVKAMRAFVRSRTPKVAANLRFEGRWSRVFLGCWPKHWDYDTLLSAHWLDCRRGITGLKFQAFVQLGVPTYDAHIEPFRSSKGGGYSVNRLKEVDPHDLLLYCGLDSLLEILVANRHKEAARVARN